MDGRYLRIAGANSKVDDGRYLRIAGANSKVADGRYLRVFTVLMVHQYLKITLIGI